MKILAIGHRREGKTSYVDYVCALFRKDGRYKGRHSDALKVFSLSKDAKFRDIDAATSAVEERSFELRYVPKGILTADIRSDFGLYDFTFIDVPGGVYDDFLKNPKPKQNWDYYFNEYEALIIIVDGKKFAINIAISAYADNLISCAAHVANNKSIPTYLVISHADEMVHAEIQMIEDAIGDVNRRLATKGFLKIPYVFVDLKRPDGSSLNSHLLDSRYRKNGQLPFFYMLQKFMRKRLNVIKEPTILGKLWGVVQPSERERLNGAIKDIQKIIDRI